MGMKNRPHCSFFFLVHGCFNIEMKSLHTLCTKSNLTRQVTLYSVSHILSREIVL